ncbi:NUDIX hydrolase [Aurantimonas sp. VKM B-3413]|uniref:NUDIX hydrolase n=1 Tax=Aurantimonas sp. VKM B-3413 TaxID=2779401 RepID=UPI001E4F90F2|nr:NUDIX domain-containing protein [Aurantimonas sp. VKM B-3413]MCB8840137.1 NUDIX domain-containing protein [Aurantimonas sp. VKM B-3413]
MTDTDPKLASDWTPPQRIRPIAIALICDGNHALLMEVRDHTGLLKGFRPVGGGIEFGETAAQAVAREFREELGWEPLDLKLLTVCENLFKHNGSAGHEIAFVFQGKRPDEAPPADRETRIDFQDHGVATSIRWVGLPELRSAPLFPDEMQAFLRTAIAEG